MLLSDTPMVRYNARMKPRRPVTRVCLVLPALTETSSRDEASAEHEALADLIARDLAAHGVSVTRHVAPGSRDRGVRADVAVWFSETNGAPPRPDPKEVPARAHVLWSPGGEAGRAPNASRYDAIFVPHSALQGDIAGALGKTPVHRAAVHACGLPFAPVSSRDSEKTARKIAHTPVVLVDVRDRFWSHIDRVMFQLALAKEPAQIVFLAPATDEARGRVRELADKSGLDAWLTSGAAALTHSAPATDLYIGRPSWTELMWLAAHRVQVAYLAVEGATPSALVSTLRAEQRIDEVSGVLQLAAYVDRRLSDHGGMRAKGTLLEAALKTDARAFLDALGDVEPRPVAMRGGWETVGPHAQHVPKVSQSGVVDARVTPAGTAPKDRAAAIEDALAALKKKLDHDEGAAS